MTNKVLKCCACFVILLSAAMVSDARVSTECDQQAQFMDDGSTQYVDCHGKVVAATPAPVPNQPAAARPSAAGVFACADQSPACKKYEELQLAHYQSDIDSYRHTESVFRWQHTSSIIIFWTVLLLVVSGLVLAALQFRDKDTSTTIKGSIAGEIEVKSPVIGLLILTISLGFFSLYLRYVYPVQEVSNNPPVEGTKK
jgi:hypothetical protein